MREAVGNCFEMHGDLLCITTNRLVNQKGEAIMGRGVARAAKDLYPLLPKALGAAIKAGEDRFRYLGRFRDVHGGARDLAAFPTKHDWRDKSDLDLIVDSAQLLMECVERLELHDVLLPRPGCSNGGLRWEDVRAWIDPILDDRVVVTHFG